MLLEARPLQAPVETNNTHYLRDDRSQETCLYEVLLFLYLVHMLYAFQGFQSTAACLFIDLWSKQMFEYSNEILFQWKYWNIKLMFSYFFLTLQLYWSNLLEDVCAPWFVAPSCGDVVGGVSAPLYATSGQGPVKLRYGNRTPLISKMQCYAVWKERERKKELSTRLNHNGKQWRTHRGRWRNFATPDPHLADPVVWFRKA